MKPSIVQVYPNLVAAEKDWKVIEKGHQDLQDQKVQGVQRDLHQIQTIALITEWPRKDCLDQIARLIRMDDEYQIHEVQKVKDSNYLPIDHLTKVDSDEVEEEGQDCHPIGCQVVVSGGMEVEAMNKDLQEAGYMEKVRDVEEAINDEALVAESMDQVVNMSLASCMDPDRVEEEVDDDEFEVENKDLAYCILKDPRREVVENMGLAMDCYPIDLESYRAEEPRDGVQVEEVASDDDMEEEAESMGLVMMIFRI